MRVALVHDYLREYGGAERVLETLHALFPEAPVYTAYYFSDALPEHFKSWDIRTSGLQKFWGIRSHFLWYTYAVPLAFEQFDLKDYDLIISSSAFAAKGVITHPKQIHIDYCHTPTRFLWGINRTSNRRMVHMLLSPVDSFLRQWDFAASARVDHFIANSQVVHDRIERFYKRESVVIYPPVTLAGAVPPDASIEPYYLVVSRLERLKNVELIVKVFTALNKTLKVVGTGSQLDYLKTLAGSSIEFCGFVSDEDKVPLYSRCKALVVATENEDFGMTLPECQMTGRPVIALRSGGYVESIVENVTGVFFDTADEASLSGAVEKFETMQFDPEVIRKQGNTFSEQTFKFKLLEFIQKVS